VGKKGQAAARLGQGREGRGIRFIFIFFYFLKQFSNGFEYLLNDSKFQLKQKEVCSSMSERHVSTPYIRF
jgi:hypothetical protein